MCDPKPHSWALRLQNRPLALPSGNCGLRAQRGFSLVELMVGLTIGLLVVLAAIGSLIFTQATSAAVDESSRLQQKADAVFRNIGYHVSQSGAYELVDGSEGKVVFSSAFTGFNTGSTHTGIYRVWGENGASNAADSLGVSYEDSGTSRDCLGSRPTTANVDSKFYVDATTKDLMCKGATSAAAQSVADGVEDLQVTYGVQSAGATPYQFHDASAVSDWTSIQAVRICLQVAGDNKGNPQPNSLVFKGCRDQTVTNDGLLRRTYWRTFSLRSALL